MISLAGKKALVTGGSRGIGRATAELFARAGCDVAINFNRQQKKAEEVQRIIEQMKRECLLFKADISDRKEVEMMVEGLMKKWRQLDILVNNAGIWTCGEMGSMSEKIWADTMRVNVNGVYYATNAVVPYMKEKKRGVIIMVSSTAGIRGEAFHSHYAASKGALISLSKSLAVELAPNGIRVNCVAPGWVDTDMCEEVFRDPEYRDHVKRSIPLDRVPPPEDIAGPILFLASDLARHITGEVLNVNGGAVLCS